MVKSDGSGFTFYLGQLIYEIYDFGIKSPIF